MRVEEELVPTAIKLLVKLHVNIFWLILSNVLVDIVFVISRLNAKQSHEPMRGIG